MVPRGQLGCFNEWFAGRATCTSWRPASWPSSARVADMRKIDSPMAPGRSVHQRDSSRDPALSPWSAQRQPAALVWTGASPRLDTASILRKVRHCKEASPSTLAAGTRSVRPMAAPACRTSTGAPMQATCESPMPLACMVSRSCHSSPSGSAGPGHSLPNGRRWAWLSASRSLMRPPARFCSCRPWPDVPSPSSAGYIDAGPLRL